MAIGPACSGFGADGQSLFSHDCGHGLADGGTPGSSARVAGQIARAVAAKGGFHGDFQPCVTGKGPHMVAAGPPVETNIKKETG
ncbi:MAG: hypothetical protein JSS02_34145 [Planctomycetes bacterium]|nr:hypothetical protein [Planctomycetota bacterium]